MYYFDTSFIHSSADVYEGRSLKKVAFSVEETLHTPVIELEFGILAQTTNT
jgi:hypothetical protein